MQKKKQINIEIGQRLKQNREKAGMTQEVLAELVGLGVKHISAIERGAVGISLTTLRKICRTLAIPSDALIFGDIAANDTSELAARLERLPPRQYQIACDVLYKLLEAFAVGGDGK